MENNYDDYPTYEEICAERANTYEYFVCEGKFLRRSWNETGKYANHFEYKNHEWIPSVSPRSYYIDEYGDRLTPEEVRKRMNV